MERGLGGRRDEALSGNDWDDLRRACHFACVADHYRMGSPYRTDLVFREHRGDWHLRSCLVDLGLEFVPEGVGSDKNRRLFLTAYEIISRVRGLSGEGRNPAPSPVLPVARRAFKSLTQLGGRFLCSTSVHCGLQSLIAWPLNRQMSLSGPSRQ
jgi:hypothetical protein